MPGLRSKRDQSGSSRSDCRLRFCYEARAAPFDTNGCFSGNGGVGAVVTELAAVVKRISSSYAARLLLAQRREQDAKRAEGELKKFAAERGWKIAATYVENESGATLKRPELFRLLIDCQAGDILLVEQIDRLTRLNREDWDKLRGEIEARDVLIVSLDLPTSWAMMAAERDETMQRIFKAMNTMMLDILAALARKDYEDRRRRQSQGIAVAKAAGLYRGRPEDKRRNDAIVDMLRRGQTWESIRRATGCSQSTLARLAKRLKKPEGAV